MTASARGICYVLEAVSQEQRLRLCLRKYVGKDGPIADLLQDTYLRLLQTGSASQPELQSVIAFALTAARNVAIDWQRRQRRSRIDLVAPEYLDVAEDRPRPDEALDMEQRLERIGRAVESLPSRRQKVFTLRRIYGFSHREIAAQIPITQHTIEQHVTQSVRQLTHEFPDERSDQNARTAPVSSRMVGHALRQDRRRPPGTRLSHTRASPRMRHAAGAAGYPVSAVG